MSLQPMPETIDHLQAYKGTHCRQLKIGQLEQLWTSSIILSESNLIMSNHSKQELREIDMQFRRSLLASFNMLYEQVT